MDDYELECGQRRLWQRTSLTTQLPANNGSSCWWIPCDNQSGCLVRHLAFTRAEYDGTLDIVMRGQWCDQSPWSLRSSSSWSKPLRLHIGRAGESS